MIDKYLKRRKICFVLLLVGICMMSIGFAAFSTTLNISSSANVSPSSSDFKVVFSSDEDSYELNIEQFDIVGIESGGAIADDSRASVSNLWVSDLNVIFSAPGQSVTYTFYVHNVGEYDAYLKSVSYTALDNGNYKKCSATTTDSTKATDSLVQAACEDINVTISIGETSNGLGSNISGHKLSKGSVEEIQFKIEYVSGATLADGPFKVDISDFELEYSTVDGEPNLILFSVWGLQMQAEEGMTWRTWLDSKYNTGIGSYHSDGGACVGTMYLSSDKLDNVIEAVAYRNLDICPT